MAQPSDALAPRRVVARATNTNPRTGDAKGTVSGENTLARRGRGCIRALVEATKIIGKGEEASEGFPPGVPLPLLVSFRFQTDVPHPQQRTFLPNAKIRALSAALVEKCALGARF